MPQNENITELFFYNEFYHPWKSTRLAMDKSINIFCLLYGRSTVAFRCVTEMNLIFQRKEFLQY